MSPKGARLSFVIADALGRTLAFGRYALVAS